MVRGTSRYLPPISPCSGHGPCLTLHARASATKRGAMPIVLRSPVRPSEDGRVGRCSARSTAMPCDARQPYLLGEPTSPRSAPRPRRCRLSKRCSASALPARAPPTGAQEKRAATGGLNSRAMPMHHRIRNIMGCLVARWGGAAPEMGRQVLAARLPRRGCPDVSRPMGCTFLGPIYDASWGLPSRNGCGAAMPSHELPAVRHPIPTLSAAPHPHQGCAA